MFSCVADDGKKDKTDECLADMPLLNNIFDGGHQKFCTNRDKYRDNEQPVVEQFWMRCPPHPQPACMCVMNLHDDS